MKYNATRIVYQEWLSRRLQANKRGVLSLQSLSARIRPFLIISIKAIMYSESQCHIHLLSDQEIKDLYAAPQFNNGERTLYFSLTDEEMIIVKKYRTIKAQIYFIRLLGYFKAKQRFYKLELSPDDDTQYILEKYFNGNRSIPHGQVDIKTYKKQKNDILILLDFFDWLPKHTPQIQSHLGGLI